VAAAVEQQTPGLRVRFQVQAVLAVVVA